MPKFIYIPAPASSAKTVTYLAAYGSSTNASTYTFTSSNIGTASASREVFVVIGFRQSLSSNTVTSVTIAGVSATLGSEASYPSGPRIAIAFASVPSGSTGDIVVNLSGSVNDCVIGVYRVTGRPVSGAAETDFAQRSQGTSAIVASINNVDVLTSGFTLSGCVPISNTSNGSVSGVGVTFNGSAAGDNLSYFGSSPVQGSPSSGTVQWTWNSLSTAIAAAWSFV